MRFERGNILLSPNEEDNFVQIDNEDFLLLSLNEDYQTSKGASSNVFILNDPNGDSEDNVIKICKSPLSIGNNARVKRFKREIRAFKSAKRNGLRNVVEFMKEGIIEIDIEEFHYFVMDKADNDLV